ncbi:DUF6167 family protein [Streptomyces sp. SBT349]|uniref:DUF6167 family protein n=1 Tax=Streptomyces sp. SBT349 TaxID=1580539 RepID=UPI00066AB929|nr:DUF6167 family protein [Streptomyces sp. SBT349]
MFRRAFWFTTGAAAGVWATTKVQRTLRGLAPDSLAVRAAGHAASAGLRVRDFALDVRSGMAQRENELNDALGIAPEAPAPEAPAAEPSAAEPSAAEIPAPPTPRRRAERSARPPRPERPEKRTTDGVG